MIFVFVFFATLLVFLSYRSFRGGMAYLRYIKSELAKPRSVYAPFATIIAPCRGIDEDLKENLEALLRQNYPGYEVIFVVDDENDPAVRVINEIINRKDAKNEEKRKPISTPMRLCGLKYVIAGKAINSSQKVENLREGVLHVDPRSQVFVFVDSDARPAKDWLVSLVAPLENESVGAATGYRWFISPKPSFASELRSAWNASIASALGANQSSNFCWGGSTAIRRETFEELNVRDRWSGTLSDDFTLTRVLKDVGLGIYFVPKALTASVESCTFPRLFEFTNRKMKITRVYAPHLWKLSLIGSAIFCITLVWAILLFCFTTAFSFGFIAALATILSVVFFSIGKAWLRLKAVKLILTGYSDALRNQTLPQLILWPLSQFLFLYNCVIASFSRRIKWRGITYELTSASKTCTIPSKKING